MGIWEIALIAFVALVVAGPERLPEIMRSLGEWAGRGKLAVSRLQNELEREGRSMEKATRGEADSSGQVDKPKDDSGRG